MKGETHHGAWLEVHEDCTWDVLATRCLVVVHIDALELEAAWEHGAVEEDASDEHQITENNARLNKAVVSVFISSLKIHHTMAFSTGQTSSALTQSLRGTCPLGRHRAHRR